MKTASPGCGVNVCELVRHPSVRDRLPQTRFRGAWLQTRIDAALWPRLQDHPGFGLSGLARRQQVRARIRWMNLDREHFTRIEELQQQRESAKSPGQPSHHLFWKLRQQLSEWSAL